MSCGGSYKITVICLSVSACLSVCLSVCLYICLSIHQFGIFLRNGSLVFWYLAQWQIIRIFKSWQSPYFHKNSFLPKFDKKKKKKKCKKWPQNSFIWIFWKILSFSFSWKTNIVIDISPLIPYLAKFWFLIYGSKCCQPIKSQDSLKCNNSRKKWMMMFTFGI